MKLFDSLQIKDINFRNRVFLSPMCQYSAAIDGIARDWHMVHYGQYAKAGLGLVLFEATAVSPEGRISSSDLGIWTDQQAVALKPIVEFIKSQGAVAGVQLAHAGRKAANDVAEIIYAPAAIAFSDQYKLPQKMNQSDIEKVISDFASATERAYGAGFQVIELHMAHGYLMHQFLSPISNPNKSLEERLAVPLRLAQAVRKAWPQQLPLFVRVSATDWVQGGWDVEQTIALVSELKKIGVDLIDCSTGGLSLEQKIPIAPGYQVQFAEKIKREANILTAAVGLITEPKQAQQILTNHQSDAVFLARELLRNPHWALSAAQQLGQDVMWPKQYERAKIGV